MHHGKTSLQIKFRNQNGRIILECRKNVFYELGDMLRPYLEKKHRTPIRTPISVEAQVGSFLIQEYERRRSLEKQQKLSEFL